MSREQAWRRGRRTCFLILLLLAASAANVAGSIAEILVEDVEENAFRKEGAHLISQTERTGEDKKQAERIGFMADSDGVRKREAPKSACQLASESMLRESRAWNDSNAVYEQITLQQCLDEWAGSVLPAGMTVYPTMVCEAAESWRKTCVKANGMIVEATVLADFADSEGQTSTRKLKFPNCVSASKPCTQSKNSADYLWELRLEQISAWCSASINPSLQCANVKISSNFWTVASWPRVVRILIGVFVTIPSLLILTALFCYYRYKRKKQHDSALERTLLLKQARQQARQSLALQTNSLQLTNPLSYESHSARSSIAEPTGSDSAPLL